MRSSGMLLSYSFLLVGCQTMASAGGWPTGDMKKWEQHNVQVDEAVVGFSIPPGASADYPEFEIPKKIDLGGANTFDEAMLGPTLLLRGWDYRSNRFSVVDGSLVVTINVSLSLEDLTDSSAIQHAVEESSRRYAEKMRNEGHARAPNPPTRFDDLVINGKPWLRVSYKLSGAKYVTPLDNRHYLEVSLDANGFTRKDWQADARSAADAILNSIRINPAN